MEIKYFDYFKEEIKDYFNLYASDLEVEIYDDYEYDSQADVIVILKEMTGTIQNKTISIPYQLLVRCKDNFKDEVKTIIDRFAFDKNENIATNVPYTYINQTTLNIASGTMSVKQYFSTSTIIGAFEDEGIEDYCSMTSSVTIFTYDNPLNVTNVKVNYNSVDIALSFTQFVFTYAANTESTGGIGSNGACKQFKKTSTTSYVVTALINDAMGDMLDDAIDNELDSLTLKFSFKNANKSKSCIVSSIAITQDYQGFPFLTMNLVEGA